MRHLRINMILGTFLYSRSPEDAVTRNNDKENKDEGRRRTIEVYGTIFAGTLLQIGNQTLIVEHTAARMRYQLDKTGGGIIGVSLH